MNASQFYMLLSIIILAIVALIVFAVRKGKNENRLTPLAGLAFGFVIAGVLFGENRLIGYGLMAIGVMIAVFDIVKRLRKR